LNGRLQSILAFAALPYIRAEFPAWGKVARWFGISGPTNSRWDQAPERTLRGKRHGYAMSLRLSNMHERTMYFLGRAEELEVELFWQKVVEPGGTFIDVGANVGMVMLLGARLVGTSGRVHAFEPNPVEAGRLRGVVERNGLKHVAVHQAALGEEPAKLRLHVPHDTSSLGWVGDRGPAEASTGHFEVDVMRGDDVLQNQVSAPVFVKIDVEGFECRVIRGMEGILRQFRPVVVTEVEPAWLQRAGASVDELFALMEGHGYQAFRLLTRRQGLFHRLRLERLGGAAAFGSASRWRNVAWLQPDSPSLRRLRQAAEWASPPYSMAKAITTRSSEGEACRTQLLYVTTSDPWSPWTGSGFGPRLANELKARGRLHGAIWPGARSTRELLGPSWLRPIGQKLRRVLGRRDADAKWEHENDGIVGQVLRQAPPGTPVMYHFLRPAQDLSLPIRRFYFLDITVRDAVRTGSYGHEGSTEADILRENAAHRELLRNVEGIMTFSTYGADSIAAEYGYPRDKITAIGSGPVRPIRGEPDLSPQRYERGEILFVGRNWQRKGGPTLLQAFGKVRQAVPRATLTILGARIPPPDVPGVNYLGLTSDRELQERFARASLFCMPAVCETWGLVYGEAAWAGLPIAGYRAWAMPDIVEHGVSGLLTERMDADGLAEILIQMLGDPGRLRDMGAAAARRARRVLDWPQVMDRLMWRVWPEALEGREPVWMQL
jgi:FkbM family methyltransferase